MKTRERKTRFRFPKTGCGDPPCCQDPKVRILGQFQNRDLERCKGKHKGGNVKTPYAVEVPRDKYAFIAEEDDRCVYACVYCEV